ncbi:hypothetical protein ETB97_011305 [Aspergillus alliaceus]|uniref:Vacuolar ATPase assembly protein VMA22 n=1 Tax=Petromyces alliaceus TaxID=209559 RepID=A0A5N6G5E1_PETAA|nr:uncharacterized protein BDW43DRAFT_266068 [Aspergillus alliaceus]KAB8236795.1 hypothetical protein BDW43DRAFT_266068 [Aspergillus alliaceus]KAF5862667.1 hypothetical protein ETB97_011305 [Aspergillus burnettii]
MAQIPTPPASPQGSESPDVESKPPPVVDSSVDLLQSLDTLLERYLHLLDRHQELQAELATVLSSGFLSLAQANYTCPPGRRYGADYYDERMKATRRVDLEPPTSYCQNVEGPSVKPSSEKPTERDHSRHIFTIQPATSDTAEEQPEPSGKENQSKSSDTCTSEHTSLEKRDPTASPDNSEPQPSADTGPKLTEKKPRSSDPIRWYGILVSPFLRSAQKSFTEAVGGPLPELASVVIELQVVEKQVKRMRGEIGKL